MYKSKIRENDKVMVLTGKDQGKIGKVKRFNRKDKRLVLEQVNIVKRHVRANPHSNESGGIQDKEAPVHISNVALVCDNCTKPTRVGFRFTDDGRKRRYCKKCNELID
jgi:large subunit ribosomal protein L24